MLEDGSEVDFRVFSVEICVFIEFDDKFSTLNKTVKMAEMRNFRRKVFGYGSHDITVFNSAWLRLTY